MKAKGELISPDETKQRRLVSLVIVFVVFVTRRAGFE
jgi:hypothetical protein